MPDLEHVDLGILWLEAFWLLPCLAWLSLGISVQEHAPPSLGCCLVAQGLTGLGSCMLRQQSLYCIQRLGSHLMTGAVQHATLCKVAA